MTRKLSTFGLVLAAILALAAAPAQAQYSDYGAIQRLLDGETANGYISAITTHTPLIIKYVGSSSAGGTVTIAAGGDMSLATGPVGGSAADTTVNTVAMGSPCGATPGTLDLSTPAATCDTLGELINVINKSPNWRVVLRDGFASDSTDNTLDALAETAANAQDGLALKGDTAVTFDIAVELTAERGIQRSLDTGRNNALVQNPSGSSRVALFQASEKSTFGGGTSTWEVFSCKTLYPTTWTGGIAGGNMTETCTQLDSQGGGATTVEKVFTYPFAMESKKGERLVVRLNNSTAMTAGYIYAYARVAPLK